MMKQTDVIDLMSPEGRTDDDLVIDLASPRRAGEAYSQDAVEVDSNNFLAQLQGQEGSQEAAGEQACHQAETFRVARKRVWSDIAGFEQQPHRSQRLAQPRSSQQQIAQHMQWGSTGPRMQRSRVAAGAGSEAVVQPAPAAAHPTTPTRRRLTLVSHRQQAVAAAAAADSPAIVIDDDMPTPTAIQQQQHRPSASTISKPAPTAILSNPRFSSRGTIAAPAAAAPAVHRPRSQARARYMRATTCQDEGLLMYRAGSDSAVSSGDGSIGNSSSGSDADLARKVQEQEDAELARRLMQQEQLEAERQAVERQRRRLELMRQIEAEEAAAEAAAAAAAAEAQAVATGHRARGRRGGRAPQRAEDPQQQQHAHHRFHHNPNWGMAMAHALLQLPRWGGGGAGRGRGLPPGLTAMREAVLGMQAAGLPPHLLFSDRDFGADDYEMLLRLDETVEKKGAASNTIEAMPTQTVPAGGITGAAGEKLSCAVCLEEYVEGAELRTLPCLHKFHKGCIDKWLGVKASCPVCNRECK